VRAYSKHEANFIFRVKDLNWIELARGFGLLRLPKMPELKAIKVEGFSPAEIDWDDYKFADKTREKERVRKLKEEKERRAVESKKPRTMRPAKPSTPWSAQLAQREKRDLRKQKKERKKEFIKNQERESAKRAAESKDDEDEWDVLQREERLAKKVKKGKMNKREFEDEFMASESGSEPDFVFSEQPDVTCT